MRAGSTLAIRRLDRRAVWIAVGTLTGSLVMQAAIVAGAVLRGGSSSYDGTSSLLLSSHPHLTDVVMIVGTNCAWLIGISLLAWPIARLWSWGIHDTWDHPYVNVAARFLYPFVAFVLLALLWWLFSEQAVALDADLSSHWALFATLPHGTPEFGALLLPLAAAVSCIFAPAEKPGRLLVRAIEVALPLFVFAAFVEVYLTPHLLIPFRG